MGIAADGHYPAPRYEHAIEQQPGQREVAQVVGAELQLEAVDGGLLGGVHHSGVVE